MRSVRSRNLGLGEEKRSVLEHRIPGEGGVRPRGALHWSALEVLKAAQRKRASGSKGRFRKGSRNVPRLPYFGS